MAETYDNVKLILDEMDIEAVEFSVSADIKMCKKSLMLMLMLNNCE